MLVWLFDVDGKIPNLALMRLAAHHRERGNTVELRKPRARGDLGPMLWEQEPDLVYASCLFGRGVPIARAVQQRWPAARIGGTGWSLEVRLEDLGIGTELDYSIYPDWSPSLGFSQRGCRRRCKFCLVPRKEGQNQSVAALRQIWRGRPWPRHLLLLDNDFFGQPEWRDRVAEARDGGFAVCLNQGIDCRSLTDEQAEALATMRVMDNEFKSRRVYTAWDSVSDEAQVMRGLRRLLQHFEPRSIMVYMLVGFDPQEDHAARERRRMPMRELGVLPYVMPYQRTPELLGYQRWVNFSYDKGLLSWEQWATEGYQAHGHHRRAKQKQQMGIE